MKKLLCVGLVLCLVLGCAAAMAEVEQPAGYPKDVISWIIPSTAGGAADTFTRALGNAGLGGNVVVENISGGNQSIGMSECFTRPADGQTLITLSTTGLITMPLTSEVIYSAADFRYITKLANDSVGVAVTRPGSELETAEQLWDLLNGDREITVGVSSIGGHSHVEFAHAMMQIGKYDICKFVVYKGSNGVMQAVQNGEVEFGLMDDNYIVPYVNQGDLRALMTLYSDRTPLLPEIKCLGEYGIEGLAPLAGVKIVALKKDTPDDIVEWIKQQINATILGDEYQKFLIDNGAGAMTEVPTEESITQWVADATESWDAVLTQAGLK
ncbi:MAG: hypothetical protein J5889_04850 [Clostridia bacterium]|nr:hypothetical protein [Clostridia bacterium]